jgi:CheY-like chemotaxis protein/two-component sensor histidine kinase
MVRLVEDLLDVSRISRGKLTIRKELVDLGSVMKSAVDTVRPLLAAKDQSLSITLPQEVVHLQADPVRLSQVFSNLLNNATKYTPPGGRVALAAVVEDGIACVRITDSGRGISPATLPVMFDMFVQDTHTDLRGQPGLGVGLALAKRLVELHGGSIEASSVGHGHGSTFSVRMAVETAPELLVPERESRKTNTDYRHYRLLLVDDNVDFATSLCALLRKLGHEVEVAHDAPEALAVATGFRPDFAFLDIGLPSMDGYELGRRLHKRLSSVTLVAISGWGQKEDRRRASEAGFAWYLVKPVDLGSIRSILEARAPGQQQLAPRALM